jgi:D-inositol-3-phosphate glycosyltransferase
LNPQKRYILQLGRMVQRKGVETVVRGFAHMINTVEGLNDVELLIVGGETEQPDPTKTPEMGRLMLIVDSLGITSRVHFVGKRNRGVLLYYYNASEIFVTTPWYEPFGITPLEAMACGKPVIGSRVGGIRYSVVDGETGILVPPKNPVAVAHAMHRLLAEPSWARALGANGKKRVQQFFTWQIVVQELMRLYERVVGEVEPTSHEEPVYVKQNRESLFASIVKGGRAVRTRLPALDKKDQPWLSRLWESIRGGKS